MGRDLSQRELEVARLVADGCSNHDIAARLGIAQRTAEGHVEQILNKLGFHSRAQVAAWFVERRYTVTASRPGVVASITAARVVPTRTIDAPRIMGIFRETLRRRTATFAIVMLVAVLVTVSPWPDAPTSVLEVVAGIGTDGFSGDGGPAIAAQISEPTSMVLDASGSLVFADSYREYAQALGGLNRTRIRRVDAVNGKIRSLAGDGTERFFESDTARAVAFEANGHVGLGPQGELYCTIPLGNRRDSENWVGRVDTGGRLSLVIGGSPADRIAWTQRELYVPTGLAVSADGAVYVIDSRNYQVVRVTPAGSVTIVAGTGRSGDSGDGGPAFEAAISEALEIELAPDGSLHIADTNNHRVRAVDHGGVMRAIAGDGRQGFAGDGGPATKAMLSLPSDVAFARDGTLYIADTGNARVRAVSPAGTISTVAGPQGLQRPTAVTVDATGRLYIGDAGTHRIYRLRR